MKTRVFFLFTLRRPKWLTSWGWLVCSLAWGFSMPAYAQLKIVTTTGMIADLTQQIGGDQVEVTALMKTGVDPHLYKATQGDLRKLLRADLILYNGLHLEGKMQDIFEKMARKKAVFAISETLPAERLLYFDQHPDPHIWFDVALWQTTAEHVLDILQRLRPQHSALFATNAQRYFAELSELDDWARTQIQRIPERQRILITAHDAFGYLGQAYGLRVMGLQGISTAAEFGLRDIKQLKEVIVNNGIQAVFVESSVSPRFIESLVKGVAAEGHTLRIGGELFSDAMGLPDTPEGTYIGMVRHNIHTLVEALSGVPDDNTQNMSSPAASF